MPGVFLSKNMTTLSPNKTLSIRSFSLLLSLAANAQNATTLASPIDLGSPRTISGGISIKDTFDAGVLIQDDDDQTGREHERHLVSWGVK